MKDLQADADSMEATGTLAGAIYYIMKIGGGGCLLLEPGISFSAREKSERRRRRKGRERVVVGTEQLIYLLSVNWGFGEGLWLPRRHVTGQVKEETAVGKSRGSGIHL